MKYWKTGDELYIGDPFGDAVELTEAEYESLKLKKDKLDERAYRDDLIQSFEWRIRRHQDQVLLGENPTEPLMPLLMYIQALRDVPQQEGFPYNIQWPEVPEEPTSEE